MKKKDTPSLNGRIPVKIGKETLLFPAGWHHITLAQALLMFDPATGGKNFIDILSIVTGKPKDFWIRVDHMDIENVMMMHFNWLMLPIDFSKIERPQFIEIAGKKMEVPKDLGYKSFGQRISFSQELKMAFEANKESTEAVKNFQLDYALMPYTLALYFYEEFHGVSFKKKFDDDAIREFAKNEIMHLPITDAYPVASFFLLNRYGLPSTKNRRFQKFRRHANNNWRGLIHSTNSAMRLLLTTWQTDRFGTGRKSKPVIAMK